MASNVTFTNFSCSPEDEFEPQHGLYHFAHVICLVAYLAPSHKKGLLFMHSTLAIGFFLLAMWSWNVICSPNLFSWNFLFVLLNLAQLLNILYTMRRVKLPLELEDIYRTLFQPLQVSRLSFQKLVHPDCVQMLNLQPGEAYAMQNLTKTDRLGLLLRGKVNVISGQHFLHHILAREFLDSPEFESSRAGKEEFFRVSVIATSPCRCIVWQRPTLEFLLIQEPHLSAVLSLLLSRDITRKLYAMNEKMVTEKGSHLDIRLPSFTGSMASQEDVKKLAEPAIFGSREFPRENGNAHERPFLQE